MHMTPAQLNRLTPQVHQGLLDSFSNSIHSVFLWAIPFAAAGFVITLLLREIPLRERQKPAGASTADEAGAQLEAAAAEPAPAGEGR